MIQPPWYGKVEKALAPYEQYIDVILIGIILITLLILILAPRTVKMAWAVYMLAP